MPEGDSLRRAAARLAPILTGQRVTALKLHMARGVSPRLGEQITSVEAVGKHLLIDFEGGLTLRTHLGMAGRWRVLPPGVVPAPNPRTRVVIATGLGTAVCTGAPAVETFARGQTESPVAHLGPDLSDDEVDLDEVVTRTRRLAAGRLLAEALLDQRIAAGVGNVFKSEVAFLARRHPFTPIERLDDDALREVWSIAHQQLRANRDRPTRSTTTGLRASAGTAPRMYVYGRARRPCLRCGTNVEFDPAGQTTDRSTYWCPSCQA